MKISHILIFLLGINFSNRLTAQLSLNDVVKSTQTERDQFVEFLTQKNFRVIATPGYWLGAHGKYFDEVTLSSSHSSPDYNNNYIHVELENSCEDANGIALLRNRSNMFEFHGNTYSYFKKIETELKTKYKKIDFFLDQNIHAYVTKYEINGFYVFIGNKPCSDLKGNPLDLGYLVFENYISRWH
jgi:hypothetical protein